jgi:hypothetical protein
VSKDQLDHLDQFLGHIDDMRLKAAFKDMVKAAVGCFV